MSDDLDPLRRARPDRLQPDDPLDPAVLSEQREQLMSTIDQTVDPATGRRMPSIYPRLAYRNEVAALEYLTRVFGFRERRESRMEHADGMLAWLEVGDGVVMISRSGPEHHDLSSPADLGGANTSMINVYVDDVDAHHARAVAGGARIVMDLEDMFWGDRRYEALDLEGHRWHFGERLSHVRERHGGRGAG